MEDPTKHNWVGSIETNSGIKFNIEDPTPEMVDINDIATALGMICRYNGQIPSFYSVAEHSVRVADWLLDNGYPELALQGLMHDSAEAYVGDIVRPMKLIPDFAAIYNEFEKNVEVAIGEKFDISLYPMHPKVKEADKAIYEWEVENIRTGDQMGLGQYTAISRFERKFEQLSALTRQLRKEHMIKVAAEMILGAEEESECFDPIDDTTLTLEEIAQIPISPLVPKPKNDTGPGEVRITNPVTGGQKGKKLARFDLVPVYPLTVLAEHYGLGAEKYDDNQWRKGYEWSLSYAAMQRHLTAWWNGEDLDPEFGDSHLAAVAWHAFALLEYSQSHPELDDRYGSG